MTPKFEGFTFKHQYQIIHCYYCYDLSGVNISRQVCDMGLSGVLARDRVLASSMGAESSDGLEARTSYVMTGKTGTLRCVSV